MTDPGRDRSRFEKPYTPRDVEEYWYRRWIERGYFTAEVREDRSPRYSIVIPPPNITGSLHLGHALNVTLQDILVRWKRMSGFTVLWIPGTDHAGIATQNVVERQLAAEGAHREALGRERFVERVWKWREESGRNIIGQLKRLGASCDWSRERFTLDEGLSDAVREVFVRLYEEGLIYRGERLINWCPRCGTALSDIEVEHEETLGKIYQIRYPLEGEPGGYLTVATTRPETLLGDTGLAVHPDDPRYNHLIGRRVRLPLTRRRIPVVGDATLVDREFGTGAVKITPAHDFNDERAGQRHGLPGISILDAKGLLLPEIPDADPALLAGFAGLAAAKARPLVAEALERLGLLVKAEDHRHAVGKCYRCKTVVEPYLSAQWFVRVNDPKHSLAAPAIEAVRTGRITVLPEGWRNNYFGWMENIQDWCISRQIWWGHQIPAWYCVGCHPELSVSPRSAGRPPIGKNARPVVGREAPASCPDCGGNRFVRDPDVLDTWFSSALWPFSTLGWPERTQELARFYPTSVLVTSFDILFFWVARMIMMGLKFMGEVPFRVAYIHALVRDAQGQKMSKSKGNVIDPLGVMEQFGTDALRFTLASMASPGRDIRLSEDRIEGNRNFANKLWNAARFILMNRPENFQPDSKALGNRPGLPPLHRWVLERLEACVRGVNDALESHRFDDASRLLYQFIWHEFCDWYLEMVKVDLSDSSPGSKALAQTVLGAAFDKLLRLLHPFMPFITEELWQQFPHSGETICLSEYPRPTEPAGKPDSCVPKIIELVSAIRNLRAESNVSPAQPLKAYVRTEDPDFARSAGPYILRLARLSELKCGADLARPRQAVAAPLPWGDLYLSLEGVVDFMAETARLTKMAAQLAKELEDLGRKLSNPAFIQKASPDAVRRAETQQQQLKDQHEKITAHLRQIRTMADEA